jgi:mannose-6-phosphate isomerase-like protein (cupin superfamily)
MADSGSTGRRPVVLGPGEGRAYPMGRISAVFKADGAETGQLYSISEWWLDPHIKGPGAHSHPEDDVFYVLAGTMSVLVGTEWIEAAAGSFVVVPGSVTHDFENRGAERAGVLNVSARATSSSTCRVSRSGSPSILPAIRASEPRYGRVPPRPPAPGRTAHEPGGGPGDAPPPPPIASGISTRKDRGKQG